MTGKRKAAQNYKIADYSGNYSLLCDHHLGH
jgi:hypothetical protein